MFGEHKGHEVSSIAESNNLIRSDIDRAIKDGLFKSSRTNTILLDIRHTKLHCEETKDRLSKDIHATFQTLQRTLKEREEELLAELDEIFDREIGAVQKEEDDWYFISEIKKG